MLDLCFKWTGEPVECYYDGVENGMSTFYRGFSYNGVNYKLNDVVLFKTALSSKLGKLLCLYESGANWHERAKYRGVVKWFTKAADLPKLYTADINYDPENEVVEELRNIDTNVSLEDAAFKCTLIFAHIDDPVYLVDEMKLDPNSYFSCRYRIKRNKLVPILSDSTVTELSELHSIESTPKSFKPKNKVNDENERQKSSKKKTPKTSVSIVLTPNRAKRNLNESFNNTPNSQGGETPVLNYSIVENVVDSDKPIRIKLKLSDVQKLEPCILLDKIEGDLLEKKIESCVSEDVFKKEPTVILDRLNEDSIQRLLKNSSKELEDSNNKNYGFLNNDVEVKNEEISNDDEEKSVNNDLNDEEKFVNNDLNDEEKSVNNDLNDDKILINEQNGDSGDEMSQDDVPLSERLRSLRSKKIEENNVRRSTRPKCRKSYAEFISPVKTTPRKTRLQSCDSETPTKKKSEPVLKTPSKRTRSTSVTFDEEEPAVDVSASGRPKRKITRPRKYSEDVEERKVSPLKIQRTPGKNRVYYISEESSANSTPRVQTRSRKLSEDDSNYNLKTPSKKNKNEEECFNQENPKSRTRKLSEDSEASSVASPRKRLNKVKDIYSTPKKSIVGTPKKTPSAKMKLIREGVITPSMQCRKTAVVSQGTPLNKAREKLHVSYVPESLPCREKEFADLLGFVQGKLLDGCGGCMYVSGVPGTGKTATVTEVIRNLQEMSKSGDVPDFKFVSINGMRLTEPRQSYVEILKQLTGKTVAWEQAQSILEARFTKSTKRGGGSQPIVMLVDELDILCTKRQDVVYNLLDWPTKATAQLIVITIANTMDLPERLLMGRVTSRLGLTRLTFQAYTHKQLQEIVMRRLMGTNAFNPDAIQLVARKVASVSGDARRALDICRRAAEIAEAQGPETLVSMGHVNEALNAMITQPKVRAIKRCSRLEQLLLQAVVAEVERTGVDETTFADVFTMLRTVAGIDGFPMVSVTLALAAVAKLGSSRLLLTDQKSSDIHQRLILNVSADDIYYALRKD